MTRSRFTTVVVAALLAVATTSSAQTNPSLWRKGTALAVFGGAATGQGATDSAGGASIGWELTPSFTIEGSGLWVDGNGISTFAALIGSRVSLRPRQGVVPFVSAGVGVQNASVDVTAADVPAFYMRRATPVGVGTGARQRFDDFTAAIGGGVDVFVTHHIAIRPDVRVYATFADARTRPMTVYGVHLAYHFEEHIVTPVRYGR